MTFHRCTAGDKKETFEQKSYWLTVQSRTVREVSECQIAGAWSECSSVEVFITSEFWLFLSSYHVSSHLSITSWSSDWQQKSIALPLFWITLLQKLLNKRVYFISTYLWFSDLSRKLARLKGIWRKWIGKCKGRMKVNCKCSFEECECINSFFLNTKLTHDHDVRINGCTQSFSRLWV